MKKIFCLILCLCFIILSGCNKKSSGVTAVTTGLSFTADVSFFDIKTTYNIKISENGEMEAESVSGNTSGMKLKCLDEIIEVSFKGLSYSTNISALPDGVISEFIYSAFKNADTTTVFSKDKQYYINGENEKYSYKIYLGQTGLPLKIEETEKGITVIIKNATVL